MQPRFDASAPGLTRRAWTVFAALALGHAAAIGQGDAPSFPSQPIRIVVPTGAGSAPDVLARHLGQQLSSRLGQSIVVDNRPGAAGMIGADAVAKARPDGHTLLMAWDGMMAINPLVYKRISYAPLKDFAPVAALGRVEFVLVAHPSFAPNSVQELIDLAKSQPGRIDYASPGSGEAHHIAMEALKHRAGIDLVHVPYKGGPAALNDVLAGHVSVAFIGLTPALPHLRSGKLKALAVLGNERSPQLPAVPTVAQSLPGYSIEGSWLALFAPAGSPDPVLDKLNAEIAAITGADGFKSFMREQGMVPLRIGRAGMTQLIRDDTARFREIVDKAGIRVE